MKQKLVDSEEFYIFKSFWNLEHFQNFEDFQKVTKYKKYAFQKDFGTSWRPIILNIFGKCWNFENCENSKFTENKLEQGFLHVLIYYYKITLDVLY